MVHPYSTERIWFDRSAVEAAEAKFYSMKYSGTSVAVPKPAPTKDSTQKKETSSSLVEEVGKIRDVIKTALSDGLTEAEMQRISKLEKENDALKSLIASLEKRVAALEVGGGGDAPTPAAEEDDDDDVDLFGSDSEEDEETERIKQERLAAYADKKSKKATLIAKSSIMLDVKPWSDETDMKQLEASVRTIQMDGLLWGTGKLLPIGYGIKKLQITCVVEDDKVGTDDLEEKITAFEDLVQSVDVAAFNKI